jgi:hypothetical protein
MLNLLNNVIPWTLDVGRWTLNVPIARSISMPSPLIPLPPRNTKDGDKRAGEGLVEFCTKESRPTPPYFQADATAGVNQIANLKLID